MALRLFSWLSLAAAWQGSWAWEVTSGLCSVGDDGCIVSTNFPNEYPNDDTCIIEVEPGEGKSLEVLAFSTEAGRDTVQVNGIDFSGTEGPEGLVPAGSILWRSDGLGKGSGWKLCLREKPLLSRLLQSGASNFSQVACDFEVDFCSWQMLGGHPWLAFSGPTPTELTGPDAAFEGNRYIYAETSLLDPSSSAS